MHTDFSDWTRSKMLNAYVFWCPSPSFARQAILQALSIWVENPTQSGHVFLIPRILQRDFGRLSKFVVFHGQLTDMPLPFTPLVPFILYYLLPFDHRSTYLKQIESSHKLDPPSEPLPLWIRAEIEHLHRLPQTS